MRVYTLQRFRFQLIQSELDVLVVGVCGLELLEQRHSHLGAAWSLQAARHGEIHRLDIFKIRGCILQPPAPRARDGEGANPSVDASAGSAVLNQVLTYWIVCNQVLNPVLTDFKQRLRLMTQILCFGENGVKDLVTIVSIIVEKVVSEKVGWDTKLG